MAIYIWWWYLVSDGIPIATDLKRSALGLQKSLKWDDKSGDVAAAIGGEVLIILNVNNGLVFIFRGVN